MPQWMVYSRPECSLCEQLLQDLADLLPDYERRSVAVIDISGNPDLERKYGQRVPVLAADGEFVCAYRLDKERVSQIVNRDR